MTIALTTRRSPEAAEADRARYAAIHAALASEVAASLRRPYTAMVERMQAEYDAKRQLP